MDDDLVIVRHLLQGEEMVPVVIGLENAVTVQGFLGRHSLVVRDTSGQHTCVHVQVDFERQWANIARLYDAPVSLECPVWAPAELGGLLGVLPVVLFLARKMGMDHVTVLDDRDRGRHGSPSTEERILAGVGMYERYGFMPKGGNRTLALAEQLRHTPFLRLPSPETAQRTLHKLEWTKGEFQFFEMYDDLLRRTHQKTLGIGTFDRLYRGVRLGKWSTPGQPDLHLFVSPQYQVIVARMDGRAVVRDDAYSQALQAFYDQTFSAVTDAQRVRWARFQTPRNMLERYYSPDLPPEDRQAMAPLVTEVVTWFDQAVNPSGNKVMALAFGVDDSGTEVQTVLDTSTVPPTFVDRASADPQTFTLAIGGAWGEDILNRGQPRRKRRGRASRAQRL